MAAFNKTHLLRIFSETSEKVPKGTDFCQKVAYGTKVPLKLKNHLKLKKFLSQEMSKLRNFYVGKSLSPESCL